MSDEIVTKQPDLITVTPLTDVPCYFLGLTVENIRSFAAPQSLDLSDGRGRPIQWVILLGDNGSGKTTLLQILAALVPKEFKTGSENPEGPSRKHYVPELFFNFPEDEKYQSLLRVGTTRFQVSAQLAFGAKLQNKGFSGDHNG
jgi:ABC-type uncharacterized transport system ATPase subunit